MKKGAVYNGRSTIMLVEDHRIISEALMDVFNQKENLEIVALCRSGEEAICMLKKVQPDIILMDINLPGMNGIETTEMICANFPSIKVIGVSVHDDISYAKRMMDVGSSGYVTKNSDIEEVLTAIQTVCKGKIYISKELQSKIVLSSFLKNDRESKIELLSDREMEVVELVKQGFYSREIAMALDITIRTVNAHRSNILKKLKLKNTAELVEFVNRCAHRK